MVLIEQKGNLFDLESTHVLAHCISSDCALGMGIAKEFNERYDMANSILHAYPKDYLICGRCVYVKNVINLITKPYYYSLPTLEDLECTLYNMRHICIKTNIKKIAMPKIGTGLDRLKWSKVKAIIEEVFKDLDIQIVIRDKN